MDELLAQAITRRRLVQMAAGGAAAAGLAPLLGATPASAKSSAGNIKMWWWGQQEAVGIQSWMDDTIKKFKAQTGASVSPTLMDTAQVIPQFTKAAAAGNVPDVQFLFNGIYHMENVWLNYLKPLNGLVSDATIKSGGGTKLSQYAGKTYRTGFYSLAFGVQYNKEHFDKAGLNADAPPTTWDAFLNACDKLKSKGYIPLGGGVKDGFLGEWWLINSLTQNLNSAADALNLFIGKLDWREPKYHEHWIKLQDLHDNKFWNDDATSLNLYQGIQLYNTGKASMALNNTPALPDSQKKLGKDVVGFMKLPTFGKGKMAPYAVVDTQGFGIPAKAKDPATAAKFIDFMHSPERLKAYWTLSQQIPADSRFHPSVIDNQLLKQTYNKFIKAKHNVYIADLMPTLFWTDAMFVISQKILGGNMKGAQSGDLADKITKKWKKQNPDEVKHYTTWGKDLKTA
jgi:raffinose/stachyose/melibiose transport system substrate-binding protein